MNYNKLSKSQLLELVKKIMSGEYSSDEEIDNLLELFHNNVPYPGAANLIFHHNPELTPEEIVEKALSYKPIILPPPSDKKS